MSLEFGAGGGQGNIPLLLSACLTAPWEVAFVTSRVWCTEEQNSRAYEELCHQDAEWLNTLTSAWGGGVREEQSGVNTAQTMYLGTDLDLTTEMSSDSQGWSFLMENNT